MEITVYMYKKITPILLIGITLFSCKEKKEAPKQTANNAAIVDVMIAQPKNISHIVEANGTVVANEYVELHPEISGRITFLNVPEGKMVTKGTLIAKIYDADLQAQLQKSKVQLELAQITEQRDKKLLAVNGINQSDYDAALNQVKSIQADMNYTQSLIDKTVVKAPFDGLVGLRQVSPGAYVTASTIIATVQAIDKLKIDFTIPEEYSGIIKKGNTVEVESDAGKAFRKKAVIIATEPQINQTTRNLKIRAVLEDQKLNPGSFVKVYISAGADTKAIMIPTNCLIPDDKNNQIVLVKGGKANFVNVKTGLRESNNVEITKGLNIGDSVVVTGVLFARPKVPLKVRSVKTIDEFAKANNNN
jgi:membrane fusion protein (multidrug efflux system)